jgi:hypothetical protein
VGSTWEANGKQLAAGYGKSMREIKLQPLILAPFLKLAETSGNTLSYVDIVGVTGSIPVAPTMLAFS